MIEQNRTTGEIIRIIADNNKLNYNLLKLAEECIELSDVLIKMVTKPEGIESRMDSLDEEMGDVELRMHILAIKLGNRTKISQRVEKKANYLGNLLLEKKYENY